MFEANSLSSKYYLRDLERQFKGQGIRAYNPDASRGFLGRMSRSSGMNGLAACAVVFLFLGSTLWL